MPGAIAWNLHEGSRSEILAHYFFASIGTSVLVPHQEDHGLDLFCAVFERLGQSGWAADPFTVQVKSTLDCWRFDKPESVRWLIQHPLPLFLAVVDKSGARLLLYHTAPRFYVWALGLEPDALELRPTVEETGEFIRWEGKHSYSLSAPILDISLCDFAREKALADFTAVLRAWIEIEQDNLTRVRMGLPVFWMPTGYKTNQCPVGGMSGTWARFPSAKQLDRLRKHTLECVEYLGVHFTETKEQGGFVRAALLARHLSENGRLSALTGANIKLTETMFGDKGTYVFAGIDEIGRLVDSQAKCDMVVTASTSASGGLKEE